MENVKIILIVLALIVFTGQELHAEVIQIHFEAEVTYVEDVSGFLGGEVDVGDIVTGYYKYDSLTEDSNPLSTVGDYEYSIAPYGVWLTVEGFVFQTDPDNVNFLIEVCDNHIGEDNYLFGSFNNLPLDEDVYITHISWQLDDYSATALSSDALPLTAPVLGDWDHPGELAIEAGSIPDRGSPLFDAEVTSVWVAPEPSTIFLLGLGVPLLFGTA